MVEIIAAERARIRELIDSRRDGFGLPGEFYHDDAVYRADVETIWRRGWLFAGHSCQIPSPGDYFTYEVDGDSIIVIRGDDGQIRALHNTCRHRGTRLCQQEAGHIGRLVCPYHQWVYARDGRLVSCRGMQDDVDRAELGLRGVPVREIEGLIYISLGADPPEFEPAHELMAPLVRPLGYHRAKVAKIVDYEIRANWKLVWENNRECYHCNVNHPQYIKANFDHYNADDTSAKIHREIDAAVARSEKKWAEAGLAVTHRQAGMALFPDAERNLWYSANRTPLVDGYISESMDGRQVAPLMGDYQDADVGTVRLRTMPNFWNHSSCDHAVSTRLTAAGPHLTKARVIWLVDQNAVEGKDYRLEELMPFWQMTSEQDWELCEMAQRGVTSRAFTPGPFSKFKEYNVESFVRWYLNQLSAML